MFNEVTHSILAYLLSTVLVLVAVYAWLYKKKRHAADRSWMKKVILGLLSLALVFAVLLGITGDMSAQYLEKREPVKLAAIEGLETTQKHAPLIIGGIVSGNKIKYGVVVPGLLSFLADHNFYGVVKGLNITSPKYRPSLIVHYFFDGMVFADGLLVAVPLLFLLFSKYHRRWAWNRFSLWVLVVCGFIAVVATEFGWLVTELGRQPYIISGVMTVGDALTTSKSVIQLGFIFPTFFIILLIVTGITLRKTMSHKELKQP